MCKLCIYGVERADEVLLHCVVHTTLKGSWDAVLLGVLVRVMRLQQNSIGGIKEAVVGDDDGTSDGNNRECRGGL